MEPQRPLCFQDIAINLIDVGDDHILVQTNSKDGILLDDNEETNGDKFIVSFYDMPMVDYTSVTSMGARKEVFNSIKTNSTT